MGWRLRKSISFGKGLRVNIGKNGITGFTVGKRGKPHVTVGKNGTTIGASIPGTGLYYSKTLKSSDKKTSANPAGHETKAANKTMNAIEPAPTQTLPPIDENPNPHDPWNDGQKHNKKHGFLKRNWKAILVTFIALLLGVAMGSSNDPNPKDSNEYHELDNTYQQLNVKYKKNQKDLAQTKKKLKSAQDKADKWDKEQADQKEKQKEADDQQKQLEEQQQAQQEAAAQQAQQQAQQAQQQAQQQAAPAPQPQPAPQQLQRESMGTAHGGAFCSPEGAQAKSDRSSNILTCRTAADGRLRWKN
ncbi:DUF4236 domain-containing protein [Bifidobacterium sp. ESL0798]|uniref:DUF4236 domain-containing protein n=1 Tax=Bifidobacterium sp. ESL0798 TaxID=2983235 RepID=UPI0023F82D6E|nr:DUF4236 domain-containing protein [Bifidobacterium sp. ESL0798]WEV73426.1 DUF4236 domain-containing protein [Bifidobacterium sp. ESL0798]